MATRPVSTCRGICHSPRITRGVGPVGFCQICDAGRSAKDSTGFVYGEPPGSLGQLRGGGSINAELTATWFIPRVSGEITPLFN